MVVFVLYPVFTTAPAGAPVPLDESERALSELLDKKARLYGAIQDLDFEKAAGKISDTDYETARSDYLAQVATVIEQIDTLAPTKKKSKKSASAPPPAKGSSTVECTSCGESNPPGSKFCLECGKPLEVACAACAERVPANARFCNHCGAKVMG